MSRFRRPLGTERLENRYLLALVGPPPLITVEVQPHESVQVMIAEGEGVRAASVELSFDQHLVQVEPSSIRPGSVWDGKGMAIANVDDEAGTIVAFIFSTQELAAGEGSLLEFDFVPQQPIPNSGARVEFALEQLSLNEGGIAFQASSVETGSGIAHVSKIMRAHSGSFTAAKSTASTKKPVWVDAEIGYSIATPVDTTAREPAQAVTPPVRLSKTPQQARAASPSAMSKAGGESEGSLVDLAIESDLFCRSHDPSMEGLGRNRQTAATAIRTQPLAAPLETTRTWESATMPFEAAVPPIVLVGPSRAQPLASQETQSRLVSLEPVASRRLPYRHGSTPIRELEFLGKTGLTLPSEPTQ